MKKICFFNSVKTWGGGEKWHYETALYFMHAGYSIHFFLTENSALHEKLKDHPQINLHFVKISGLSFLNPLKVARLKKIFKKFGIEILLINLSNDLKIAAHSATKAGVKKIIYRRGSAIPIKNSILNRYIFSHWITDILANSKATAETILENNSLLFPKEKIKIIYNPIDIAEFVQRPFKEIYHRKQGEIIIGNLGRLEKQKNQKFFIKLSEALMDRGIAHKILIAGSGRLENELKQMAIAKGINENLILTGFLPNVKDLLMSCDIFILPSLWEGFGFVLAEASLCKKPIIAFKISSIPEVVISDQTGFLIEVNAVNDCVEKIILLKDNQKVAQKMGEEGFGFVSNQFDKNKIMRQVENFINEK
jgi:glycosyltransferase involved in cell wall biosynthesis